MVAKELLAVVERLDIPSLKTAPLTVWLENALDVGPRRGRATYQDQRHHWTRWLAEHQSPDRSARRIYNSINCPPMLFWLSEAVGVDRCRLLEATDAALAAKKNQAAQTASIRRVLPWEFFQALVLKR